MNNNKSVNFIQPFASLLSKCKLAKSTRGILKREIP